MNVKQIPHWQKRFTIERQIRQFLWSLDFEEVRTPLLVYSPGMEPHLRPLQVLTRESSPIFLPTSPEFSMKKLLARGMKRIFQLSSSFRDEPRSPDHRPEFTMLEFYEAQILLQDFQSRVEGLFLHLSQFFNGSNHSLFRGAQVDWSLNWPRYRVVDLFLTHLQFDLRTHTQIADLARASKAQGLEPQSDDSWDDLYFRLWLNRIEPKLPKNRPCFVTHYPVSQSSLCNRVVDETGFEWANRFEVYLGNFELGNAFDELRDPEIQRRNFKKDQETRRHSYGDSWPESPVDPDLITAISRMEPTCGIALGVDRIAMAILGVDHISDLIAVEPYWPTTGD